MSILYIIVATSLSVDGATLNITLKSSVDGSLMQVSRPVAEAVQEYVGRQVNVTLALV